MVALLSAQPGHTYRSRGGGGGSGGGSGDGGAAGGATYGDTATATSTALPSASLSATCTREEFCTCACRTVSGVPRPASVSSTCTAPLSTRSVSEASG